MSLINFRWFSRVLGKQVETQVLLPEHREGRCATFYLLHGLSDDSTTWLRRTSVERYVDGLPLITVMPDGFRGFYTKHETGPDYAAYVGRELVDVIDRVFPTIPERGKRCVGGLSMGGYGALRLALGFPDRFASATSHSGAVGVGSRDGQAAVTFMPKDEVDRVFGPSPRGTDHDLHELARRAKAAGTLPAMQLDCGLDDFLLDDNRAFAREWSRLGIPHAYDEHPGTHDWAYWDKHVRTAIAFHAQVMGIGR